MIAVIQDKSKTRHGNTKECDIVMNCKELNCNE